MQGCGDSLVGKVLILQARGREFDAQSLCANKARYRGPCLQSEHWGVKLVDSWGSLPNLSGIADELQPMRDPCLKGDR